MCEIVFYDFMRQNIRVLYANQRKLTTFALVNYLVTWYTFFCFSIRFSMFVW